MTPLIPNRQLMPLYPAGSTMKKEGVAVKNGRESAIQGVARPEKNRVRVEVVDKRMSDERGGGMGG